MFLRRAGIHFVIFPATTSSAPSFLSAGASTSACSALNVAALTSASFLSSLSVITSPSPPSPPFQDENDPSSNLKYAPSPSPFEKRNFKEQFPHASLPSSKLSVILGTTMMMGASKCKNYHRDHHWVQQHHHQNQRIYHNLHLKSSVFPNHLLASSSKNNSTANRHFSSCTKSARDHNNWPLSSRQTTSFSNNIVNFSTKKSSNVGISEGGASGDGGDDGSGGSPSNALVVTIKDGLSDRESADDFLNQLSDHQKQLIYHTLNIEVLRNKYEGTLGSSEQESHHYLSRFGRPATQKEDPTGTLCEVSSKWLHQRLDDKAPPASAAAIWGVTLKNALPFIGFGFLDNLIMILAGDYIDITIGTALGISTMAAAALGNAISDVAGIGSAWYVEELASKIGIRYPELTPSQMASSAVRWASNFGRAFGVMLGCLLGMFPLLFLPGAEEAKERKDKRDEEKRQRKKDAAAAKEVDKTKFA